jgi:predicted ATPase
MLTRLKVNGFKNLVDVDIRFGPFTCIAGVNGSGKSNLFEAIRFLALLAEKPLVEAALSIVRGSGGRSADIRSLFHRVGDEYAKEMSFEAEMIIPAEGVDDLGRSIAAGNTLLHYRLVLAYRGDSLPQMPLEIKQETLETIGSESASGYLGFPIDAAWYESAFRSEAPQGHPLISVPGPFRLTENGHSITPVGRSDTLLPVLLPRTLLSFGTANRETAVEGQALKSDPVTLARQEMRSWQVLYLDPSAMRTPDDLTAPAQIGNDGSNLAATLYSVAHAPSTNGHDPEQAEAAAYAGVRNRLLSLLSEIREIRVERDDKREELALFVKGRDGTWHSARALSDGTLRFLALAVLEAQEQPGVFCIEEPENGIHPGRIPALLDLLEGIAMDTSYPIEEGNPLRQVIISTHSPSVVMRVPADSLVVAELRDTVRDGKHFNRAHFSGLANTWRDPVPSRKSLALGTLLTYLNPEGYRPLPRPDPDRDPNAETRVMDRSDIRDLLTPLPKLDG